MHNYEGRERWARYSISTKAGCVIVAAFGSAAVYFGLMILAGHCW